MMEINDSGGWFKMHWELLRNYNLKWDSAVLLEYIIEVYPKLKNVILIEGLEYKELGTSFINEGLTEFGVDETIRNRLKPLVDKGFISVKNIDSKGNENPKGRRYVHLNTVIASDTDTVKDSDTDTVKDSDKDSDKENLQQKKLRNQEPKDTKNRVSKPFKETMDFIDSLTLPDDIKENTKKWYKNIGIKIGNNKDTLKDKLVKIFNDVNGDYTLMNQSIENAYLNGWKAFYPPKNNTYKKSTFNGPEDTDSGTGVMNW